MRPTYEPIRLSCANCGAAVELKDERSQQLVCPYCRAQIALNEQEQRVLGILPERDPRFQLELGQSFQWDGARYEVIARVALIEDGSLHEMTQEFYLYHPRRRSLVLSEYDGEFSISWATRVMASGNSLYQHSEGSRLTTGDGANWICEGTGTYEVYYVDGALPYALAVGETIPYAEFRGASRPEDQFEIQQARSSELEFGRGHAISVADVRRATGAKVRGVQSGGDSSWVRRWQWGLVFISLFASCANCGVAVDVSNQGHMVMQEQVSAQQLRGEYMTGAFPVGNAGDLIRVKVSSYVDNSWMSSNLALVEADGDTVVHVFEGDVSYYHGYEGGERWSEGSNTSEVYIQVEEPGNYHLLVGAQCGVGNSEQGGPCYQPMTISVTRGVLSPHYNMIALIFSIVLLILSFVAIRVNNGRSRPRDNPARALLKARYVWVGLALASILLSTVPTYARWGAQEMEHPDGISIRQASAQNPRGARGFFWIYNSPRRHLGGGIGGGK